MEFLKANARRIVIKIGTNSLVGADGLLMESRLAAIAAQIGRIRERGIQVCLVSSGAIGLGIHTLGLLERPSDLTGLQACAAVGQPRLMAAWDRAFRDAGISVGQILLTREDVAGRRRHIAARDTLERLLSLQVVPIINENDTISADEIKFGDNDVLSAMVASLIKADLLILLSTIQGLLRDGGKGALVPLVESITPDILAMAGGALNTQSTGGMVTKLEAANLATRSGCGTFIGNAADLSILEAIIAGTATGTFFLPAKLSLDAKRRWIAFFQRPAGTLHIDAGAAEAVRNRHSSLLAKGIIAIEGEFAAGDVVNIADHEGQLFARGICGFSSADLKPVQGFSSNALRERFPDRRRLEVVHCDRMVLL